MATTPSTEAEITQRLSTLSGWTREGNTIVKQFKLPSYAAGLVFACAVGTLADGFDHHPQLVIGYKKVTVSFMTHDAGDKLSHKDFDVADAIEALKYAQPPT